MSDERPVPGSNDEDILEDDGLDPFRDSSVGTKDPNIVGDVGPYDTPPGQDPEGQT